MVWQVGVLLVGVGFLLFSLFASFTLLNMTRSLRTIESILTLTLDEARLAVGELHPINDLVMLALLQWAATRWIRREQPV